MAIKTDWNEFNQSKERALELFGNIFDLKFKNAQEKYLGKKVWLFHENLTVIKIDIAFYMGKLNTILHFDNNESAYTTNPHLATDEEHKAALKVCDLCDNCGKPVCSCKLFFG